jgi:2-oxoisovalerate dehydrogenase E1 component
LPDTEPLDEHFVRTLESRAHGPASAASSGREPPELTTRQASLIRALFDAQVQSRHLDFAARWLQRHGKGHYTIGSAGHESNAALGLLSRVEDPALLHYRSGGFYAARAAVAGVTSPIRDVVLSLVSARNDPMSGGRHKVFGHPDLHIVPQTSTIGSHLPRAVGLAWSLEVARELGRECPWPTDAVVICSFGDASVNHSTATGAFNAAAYLTHRRLGCPVLFVCEDNGLGISTRSPEGWTAAALAGLPGIRYWHVDGSDPLELLATAEEAVDSVRTSRRPGVLHLDTVRFLGHAGSDTESGYRSRAEILADHDRDPILATAGVIVEAGLMPAREVLDRYERARRTVMAEAERALEAEPLATREEVMAPLAMRPTAAAAGSGPQQEGVPLTLAQAINATLTDLLADQPDTLVFGQDVAVKGGVYGVTRGLRKRFGGLRVFDTLLDEQTILGVALGAALAGFVPIPEIQYLAYLHNAEDQLRGAAASLRFFSNGQYQNGMVVRVAGLAYQRGFGGHFHNDNSVAVLRDIPGLVLAVPSHPADAPGMLRTCVQLAREDGRVCVFLEPIARYHARDLLVDGDAAWTAAYDAEGFLDVGSVGRYGIGRDVLLVTFGNGVHLCLRAAAKLATLTARGIGASVLDLRWLAPLPVAALVEAAAEFKSVLVVDETRMSGGVSEAVVTALVESGYAGRLARVASADSYVPLGPAAATVLLGEAEIVTAAVGLVPR